MNDEIKEMLDKYKNMEINELSPKQCNKILDYITNLQQRCEYLERSNNRREDEIISLRDECIIENTCYCNRTDCVGRIKDSRKYDSIYQEKEDYKSRVEKAMELLQRYGNGTFDEELLNILQNGSEK